MRPENPVESPVAERVAALLARGDGDAAAEEVIRALGPRIDAYLRGVLRQDDDAADAFSLFSEWTWKSIGSLRDQGSLASWAFGVAWNAARRVREDPYRRRRVRLATRDASRLARPTTSTTGKRHALELEELRDQLDLDEQNLLLLRIDQRLAWDEIARVLSSGGEEVTAPTVRKRFERLKNRIAELARERGLVR